MRPFYTTPPAEKPAAMLPQQKLMTTIRGQAASCLFGLAPLLETILTRRIDELTAYVVSVAEAWLPVFRRAGLYKKDASLS